MNSIADIGGMEGFGPINPEQNEPVFHEEWERRCFGMFLTSAAAIGYGVDEFRHGMESLPPIHYLSASYYEHWLGAYEQIFAERGVISPDELEQRVAALKGEEQANA
ncbi:nitrile hydratase [Caballeronia arvi]|uniref:Nitrile hydratase n=1 Tax=Caballeronia arvi TaxID=1777135 RepID=A0A158KJM2_9BURK|nr:SH3-like domain-containing protein [Caballeronia arvi]SAL81205.1 nitrile hydratase [Caballeronia arvi]